MEPWRVPRDCLPLEESTAEHHSKKLLHLLCRGQYIERRNTNIRWNKTKWERWRPPHQYQQTTKYVRISLTLIPHCAPNSEVLDSPKAVTEVEVWQNWTHSMELVCYEVKKQEFSILPLSPSFIIFNITWLLWEY